MAGMSERQVLEFKEYLECLVQRKQAERAQASCFRIWDILETEIAEDRAILKEFLEILERGRAMEPLHERQRASEGPSWGA